MTCVEWERFSKTVNEFRDSGQWDDFANLHTDPEVWEVAHSDTSGLQAAFLPWHRVYLRRMERELQKIDPEVTLPYWNWALDSENPLNSPVLSEVFYGTTGSSNTSYCVVDGSFKDASNSTCIRRALPSDPGGFLTLVNLKQVLTESPDYGRFVNRMENGFGLHGHLHMFLGGDMADLDSPRDPLFYAHHAFVDMLWWRWQRMHNSMGSPAYKGDAEAPLYPFSESAADVFSAEEMGYTYSNPLKRNTSDESTKPCFLERGGQRDIVALGERVWNNLPDSVAVLQQIPKKAPSPKPEYFSGWMRLKESQRNNPFRSVDIEDQLGTWANSVAAPRISRTVWSFEDDFGLGFPVNAFNREEEDQDDTDEDDRRDKDKDEDKEEQCPAIFQECGNCMSTLDKVRTATCVERFPEEFGPNLESAVIRKVSTEIEMSEEAGPLPNPEDSVPQADPIATIEEGVEGPEDTVGMTVGEEPGVRPDTRGPGARDPTRSVADIVDELIAKTMVTLEDPDTSTTEKVEAVFSRGVLGTFDDLMGDVTTCSNETNAETNPSCADPQDVNLFAEDDELQEDEDEDEDDNPEPPSGRPGGETVVAEGAQSSSVAVASAETTATIDVSENGRDGSLGREVEAQVNALKQADLEDNAAGALEENALEKAQEVLEDAEEDEARALRPGVGIAQFKQIEDSFSYIQNTDEDPLGRDVEEDGQTSRSSSTQTDTSLDFLFPDLPSSSLSERAKEKREDREDKEDKETKVSLDYLFPIDSRGSVYIPRTWSKFMSEDEDEDEVSKIDKYKKRFEESSKKKFEESTLDKMARSSFSSFNNDGGSANYAGMPDVTGTFSNPLEGSVTSSFSSYIDVSPSLNAKRTSFKEERASPAIKDWQDQARSSSRDFLATLKEKAEERTSKYTSPDPPKARSASVDRSARAKSDSSKKESPSYPSYSRKKGDTGRSWEQPKASSSRGGSASSKRTKRSWDRDWSG